MTATRTPAHDPLCGLEGVLCPSCEDQLESNWIAAEHAAHDPRHAYLCAVPTCPSYAGAHGVTAQPAGSGAVIVTIPDTCPPVAVGPMTDAELDRWALDEAARIYPAGTLPPRWNAGTALTNLIGDGYVVAELHKPARS